MPAHHVAAQLLCIGLDHQSATLEQREVVARLASHDGAACWLDLPWVNECALLSTCNRVEWYLVATSGIDEVREMFTARMIELTGQAMAENLDALRVYEGPAAVRHLLAVASGVESMLIGESEILGQVSRSYVRAVEERTMGPVLDALLRAAIRCGKRVRSETSIGANPASLSSVALDLAASKLGDLSRRNILVIGLGQIGTLAHKLLRAQNARTVVLMNRSYERAQAMAQPGWSARPMEELPEALATADCVISATSAPHPIITSDILVRASELRRNADHSSIRTPWVLIDLALPRDVEPEVANAGDVTLYDLDHLQAAMVHALKKREAEIPSANLIMDQEAAAFDATLRELEVRPFVVELRLRAEAIREQELARTLRFMGDVKPETVAHLQHLTHALVNKLLHTPTVRMKEMAADDRREEVLTTICDLFDLDGSPSSVQP